MHTRSEHNKKPDGKVVLPAGSLNQREREECVKIIEKFKSLGLITVAPSLTPEQVKNLEGR